MFKVFEDYLSEKISLSPQDFELIQSVAVIKKLRKHQYLLQEGDIWTYKAFVCQGLLRSFRTDDKGVDHIIQFSIENWWAGDIESGSLGHPSKNNIEALEPTTLLLFSSKDFEMLETKIPVFKDFVTALISQSYIASQNRVHDNISMNSEERYSKFLKTYPQIANRVPQHMIASYLGISAETLSRIRKQIQKK
ncbi:Crp/Fnr family transcriptional regulator [Flavobacterium sp.]|uniref:Crp/Fnr family transcriptional regulator n=1 Tax=Flavobacterium sp. TaxID=239 RepID=UPI002B4AC3D4|nr:Crp/Fnr family transcriptional regulator [Flavobacterium sp.]HLF52636.1 Crp/Fnr family transcriptional regulator [Flavobacterium sp.]